jgi:hypothetical protein
MYRIFNRRVAEAGSVEWRWIWAPVIGFAFLAAVLLGWQALGTPAGVEIAYAAVTTQASGPTAVAEPVEASAIASRETHDFTYPYPHP